MNVVRQACVCVVDGQRSMEHSFAIDRMNGRECYRPCSGSLEKAQARCARMSESGEEQTEFEQKQRGGLYLLQVVVTVCLSWL
jgi:hypothetical protein